MPLADYPLEAIMVACDEGPAIDGAMQVVEEATNRADADRLACACGHHVPPIVDVPEQDGVWRFLVQRGVDRPVPVVGSKAAGRRCRDWPRQPHRTQCTGARHRTSAGSSCEIHNVSPMSDAS